MKTIMFYLVVGAASCGYTEIVEFEDDVTPEEIDVAYDEWRNNYLESGWCEVK